MVHGWTSFERGYIIYNNANGGDNPQSNQWEAVRQLEAYTGTHYFNIMKNEQVLTETIAAGGELLKAMAKAERAKEEMWLHSLYDSVTFPTDELGYIKTINELYTGTVKFDKVLNRLLHNLERNLQIAEENKNLPKDQRKATLRAPSMIVHYVDYFSEALRDYIEKVVVESQRVDVIAFINGDKALWDRAFEVASKEAFERIAAASHSENSKYFGEGEDYYDVIEAMEDSKAFKQFIESQFNRAGIRKTVLDQLRANKGRDMFQYRDKNIDVLVSDREKAELMKVSIIKDTISPNERRTRGLGALVQEWVKVNLNKLEIKNAGKQVKGKSISDVNATDTLVLQAEARVKIEDPYKQLIDASKGKTQAEIALQFKKFYQHWRSQNHKKFFVINTSNKLYTLTEDHRFKKEEKLFNLDKVLKHNFTSTKGGAQATLPGYGIFTNSQSIHNLTSLVYNTISGAFLDSKRKEVIDSFRQVLATGAANLLFSDYYNVGDEAVEGVNAIHLFDLDDVYIPLSAILQGMADAYLKTGEENYTKYISLANFNTKDIEILYPRANSYEGKDYKKERYKGLEISEAWNKQREAARQQVMFEIRFANNFQDIIKSIAAQYKIINIDKHGKFEFL